MTPFASVAILEKLALLKIARCRAPALSSASSATLRTALSVPSETPICALVSAFPLVMVCPGNLYSSHLESVPKLPQELHSFLSMRRMEASFRKARALRLRFSQSLASLRQRLIQPTVRSTIQRLGRTTKPLIWPERLTISVLRHGKMDASAV